MTEVREQPHLAPLRDYNHAMLGQLANLCALENLTLLDLGASIHGYALEAAMDRGVAVYEGINLDVARHWGASTVEFAAPGDRSGRLRVMNAEELEFDDASIDVLLSVSTFEHFLHPDVVLAEMFRVLRPAGAALVSFEPVWTASYGHHLHHFGAVKDVVPPWSHLFLGEEQMRELLQRKPWPSQTAIDLEGVLHWIYRGDEINRLSIKRLRQVFSDSAFEISWASPLLDSDDDNRSVVAEYVAQIVPYTAEELMTRGLSMMLRKPAAN